MLLPYLISSSIAVIMYPVHSVNTWLTESSASIPVFVRTRQSLGDEIKVLKNSLTIASRTDLTQQRLFEENNRLRKLLDIDNEERIVAAILARPDELPYDLLQIDRGQDHGVEVGAPVFTGKDVVIGLVVHVTATYSFIELVTTPGFKSTAFISGPDVVVEMEGMGGGVARVRVPQGVPLAVDNLVYLPSVEPAVFGRISYVENTPTQPEQYGFISPEISLSGLYQVAVGKQSQVTRSASEIDQRILAEIRTRLLVEGVSVGNLISTTSTSTILEEGLEI